MASHAVGTAAVSLHRIPIIGIVGGIGSGKSAVAKWVATQARVDVVDADALGHEAILVPQVKAALCERFGAAILGPDGEIVRSALAQQVFGTGSSRADARHDLEQIVHPEIERRIHERIALAASLNREAVLLDAAILLEAGWRTKCDLVVFIDTPDAMRLARVQQNRGWNENELARRESSQWSLTDKRRESDLIVTNDTNLEAAGKQLLEALRQRGLVS